MLIATILFLAPSLIALLFMSALFSAGETSLTAASRGRMHQLERDGDKAAKRVNILLGDQEKMIGAILLANNVLNIGASALTTSVLGGLFPGYWGVAISTAVMTVLILVFGEVLPKTLAILKPDDVARGMSPLVMWTVYIFGPVVQAVQWFVRGTLRLFGVRLSMEVDVLAAHEEIRGAVEYHHDEGAVEAEDRNMFRGVLDLQDLDVSQIMVHRKSIDMIDADLPMAEIIEAALNFSHTRIPMYRDNPENIIGILHARDLMAAVTRARGDLASVDVMAITRTPWFIPDTTNLKDQLAAFLKQKQHFALVVDEYGALQGLVTLEDILEEIVGEIDDEHDAVFTAIRKQSDGSIHVDGDMPIRDLNRAMDWDLPDDVAVTVAGLVIHEARTIPEPGQTFLFYGRRFQIMRRQRNQITALKITPVSVTSGLNSEA
ncbi:transporter associated domain protein [Asticcacaulis biprosthecium C19]|uniref:Transporter associated domain protein n=1 Tax=Asticcacaulis biprosthecium C19 TaxID=715226 RepID=F4QS16_9CAUL|nr:HlyC/CorC family transporter [Asticcacaulis biprosthecium]EGF89536.1 transporter associated domain protein [Asticcacaulis biprosthecium C19]